MKITKWLVLLTIIIVSSGCSSTNTTNQNKPYFTPTCTTNILCLALDMTRYIFAEKSRATCVDMSRDKKAHCHAQVESLKKSIQRQLDNKNHN